MDISQDVREPYLQISHPLRREKTDRPENNNNIETFLLSRYESILLIELGYGWLKSQVGPSQKFEKERQKAQHSLTQLDG